jgi:hypothetical protein
MDTIGKSLDQDKDLMQIPNLDWMVLTQDNIPSDFPVESIPELEKAWNHTDVPNTRLISNSQVKEGVKVKTASEDDVNTVVKQAKKEMMLGLTGKELAGKLSSLFMPEHIEAAKDQLVTLAEEQGLLGNVYIDLTPFDSCHEAALFLGREKIKTAKLVVGNPSRTVCSSHSRGFCKELNKRVVNAIDYNDDLLETYTKHLRVAGTLNASEDIKSKDSLREAFLRKPVKNSVIKKRAASPVDIDKINKDFKNYLNRKAMNEQKDSAIKRFYNARPILSFIQDQMLKGKVSFDLKESIRRKFSSNVIAEYTDEIKKVASLQGILGNLYVDVSYYKDPQEAIRAIRTANTNPLYLIQSFKKNKFDDTLEKVASATGCSILPRDGKLDKKIVFSYIKDLQTNNKIASNVSEELLDRVIKGDCNLDIIKEAFDASLSHKKAVRMGGLLGRYAPVQKRKTANRKHIEEGIVEALQAGIPVKRIEDRISSMISATEAIGMIQKVLSKQANISADCLVNCTSEKYPLGKTANINATKKCANCIYKGANSCISQSRDFEGSIDLDKAFFDIKEAEAKVELEDVVKNVQLDDNPDVIREDITQEYDMSDPFGSGMNISLDEMHNKKADEVDVSLNSEGIDSHLL